MTVCVGKRGIGRCVLSAGLACCALLVSAAGASADVRTYRTVFNPNSTQPPLTPPPTLPQIPFTVSFDDGAGTLTISEGGADPSYTMGHQAEVYILSGPDPTPNAFIDWQVNDPASSSGPGALTVDGVHKSLQPVLTQSGDTVTATYSSPLLRGKNWTFLDIGATAQVQSDNTCGCDQHPRISAYFAGFEPFIALAVPDARRTLLGRSDTVHLDAGLYGFASGDDVYDPVLTVSGLPPGMSFTQNEFSVQAGQGTIGGTARRAGSYRVTVSAKTTVAEGTVPITDTRSFTWWVIALTPRVPVYLGPPSGDMQSRPYRLVYTGDGTGFFAGLGRAGHHPRIGRLRWSRWNATEALGSGADWADDCTPDCATGLRRPYRVRLRLYGPVFEDGYYVFSHLDVAYPHAHPPHVHPRSFTWRLRYVAGRGFGWGP